MRKLYILCGWILFNCTNLMGQVIDSGILRVGVGQVDITPPLGVPMAGYYTPRGMTGIHDPLHAKTLIIDDGTNKIVIIACDLIAITKSVSSQVRQTISKKFGIPESNIAISATHSHTGPVMKPSYTETLPAKIFESVGVAFSSMQMARIKAGRGYEDKISFNRRFLMRDGTVIFNPGILNPNIVRAVGPIDPMVGIVYFETLNGKPISTWVNFSLHLDTIGGTEASADYPFYIEQILKRIKGEDMLVMFANGTCGDINHINILRKESFETRFGKAEQLGHALAGEVIKQYPNLTVIPEPKISVISEVISLDIPEYTPPELEEAKTIAAQPFTGGAATPAIRTAMRKLNTVNYLKEYSVSSLPAEIQVLSIGPLAITFLPGEIFVEHGLRIKQSSPFQWAFVVELTNDVFSYIPTKKAFGEGSYEVEVAWIKSGEGEKMVEKAVELLKEVKNKK